MKTRSTKPPVIVWSALSMLDVTDGFRRIAPGDREFPDVLVEAKPPVTQLWIRGKPLHELAPFIAVVGARRASAYGLDVARSLSATLASEGWCVVSGLAKGIDAAAHQGALATSGRTVAVLGSGIDVPYPTSNRWLYDKIASRGAIITEYDPGTRPHKRFFPERNRIIAWLSSGTILVQARGEQSGAMATVSMAGQAGRAVFAVPGDVRSGLSRGPHALLKDGAILCDEPGVVGTQLRAEMERAAARAIVDIPAALPADQASVFDVLRASPAKVDDVVEATGLDVIAANKALARLERTGLVIRLEGGTYRPAR